MVDMLSFWTFSDVFEEGGPAQTFEGQFGLRAKGGINKPSYYEYGLLHHSGTERLANPSHNIIVTRLSDGTLSIALWNLAAVGEPAASRRYTLHINGLARNASVSLQRVDENHSNVLKPYAAMGSPVFPTRSQAQELNRQTALAPPERLALRDGILTLELTPDALVLLNIEKVH